MVQSFHVESGLVPKAVGKFQFVASAPAMHHLRMSETGFILSQQMRPEGTDCGRQHQRILRRHNGWNGDPRRRQMRRYSRRRPRGGPFAVKLQNPAKRNAAAPRFERMCAGLRYYAVAAKFL